MTLNKALLPIHESFGPLVSRVERLGEGNMGQEVKLVSTRLSQHLCQHLHVDACCLQRL